MPSGRQTDCIRGLLRTSAQQSTQNCHCRTAYSHHFTHTISLSRSQNLLRTAQPERADSVDMLIGAGNSEDDVDERFEKLVEAVDALLERIVCCCLIVCGVMLGGGLSDAWSGAHAIARYKLRTIRRSRCLLLERIVRFLPNYVSATLAGPRDT